MGAFNETTGAEYRGKNVDRLEAAEQGEGYDAKRGWAGFKQWLGADRVVRKGEHGTHCLTVMEDREEAAGNRSKRGVRGFKVFHYDQTVALADVEAPATVGGGHAPDLDLMLGY